MVIDRHSVALITGGGSGIGRALARDLAERGVRLRLADIDEPMVRAAAQEISQAGGDAESQVVDVTDREAVASWVEGEVGRLGRLDYLFNNAGIAIQGEVLDHSAENWLQTLDVNLRGSFWMMRCAQPHLISRPGCVLNISSMAGVVGQANHAAYAMTKGGMNALTKSAAADWGPNRIRVNAICPTGVWTGALRRWVAEQPNPDEIDDYLDRIHALGYCPEADEVSPAAVFLCSDDASFITGTELIVDGGFTAR